MKFSEKEKDMIVIALKNEGKRFQKFADELKRGYPYMIENNSKQLAKEGIIEYVGVAQEYKELMMKISTKMEVEQ